jgi:hypothetical protein
MPERKLIINRDTLMVRDFFIFNDCKDAEGRATQEQLPSEKMGT